MLMQSRPKTPVASERWLRWGGVCLLLIASFVISFVVAAPGYWPAASVVQRFQLAVPPEAVSGTVAKGQMVLEGGFVLRWQIRPWDSLLGLRLAADVTVQGPETDLAVPVAVGLASYDIGPVVGSADAQLGQAIFPQATLRCSGPVVALGLRVKISRRTVTGDGVLRSGDLACDGAAQAVPALSLSFAPQGAGSVAALVSGPLAVATASANGDGRLAIVLHKEGAGLFPGMPASADSSMDMPLGSLFR